MLQPSLHSPSALQAKGYRLLTNQQVKDYAVRVKQPQSCEQGVQYSGYIDNLKTDDHLFFWFFESRTAPKTDPVVLWLNGGPGCSSMAGLWMELGPCKVNKDGNNTETNPYSWNTVSNMIFLDQPVNVGYSYGKSKIRDSRESAHDVYAFLQLFFSEFKEYADNPFHIAGESYGGHYLPALADEITKNNKFAEEQGRLLINFESMLIGNGWTEPRTQFKYYEEYGCTRDNKYKPLFDEATCQKMKDTYPHCKKLMDACYNYPSSLTCIPANYYCETSQESPYSPDGKRNPYDIRAECHGDLCYDIMDKIALWANREDVRSELGVDPQAGNFSTCSDPVGYYFSQAGDPAMDFSPQVVRTLSEGVRVLLYVGDMDWICNWMGNKAWSLNMEWPGKEGYNNAKDEPWTSWVTAEKAGEVRSHNNLTFLRIFDAGHMVPYDQPANALDFFSRWLTNTALNN
ncbi:Alpha/Beta hydrolase protein [Radiomyces spectabilis]|uniref:Alpha/Beta hydrolase protein n=1 Tax=Radiomyces spectabilis TaxID=64574 RepID=UPI00221F0773|nr:Alpha/Beta hydrolase protein [Radiomyces spectabilis]KAI8393866.1 Alpha/Beta hydrolase protein [Radiomyces spectabilis]